LLKKTCDRLGYEYEELRNGLRIFTGSSTWEVNIERKTVRGEYINQKDLKVFGSYYQAEKAKLQARKKGYAVRETVNKETQQIRLVITT
jgi:hypothetical protein